MDGRDNELTTFEQALTNNSKRKQTIYGEENRKGVPNQHRIEDVIRDVSKQIQAMHNASCYKNQTYPLKTEFPRKPELVPLAKLCDLQLQQGNPNKFETQCVSDTQLIDIVKVAEENDSKTGVTQEFDSTFCEMSHNFHDAKKMMIDDFKDFTTNNSMTIDTGQQRNSSSVESISKRNDVIKDKTYCISDHTGRSNMESDMEDMELFEALDDLEKSPILSKIKPIFLKTKPPGIVCKLDYFEKFEALAVPIIKEEPDFQLAKKLINSQIMSNELLFETDSGPCLKNQKRDQSPVISLKTDKTKSTLRRISEISIFTQKILEDEILFSSDEENYFSPVHVNTLAPTCALQHLSQNERDAFDQTIYVGFQTASNKSIQINSDSFIKAKNLLIENDNVELNELVNEIDKRSKNCNNIVQHDTKQTRSTIIRDNINRSDIKKCSTPCNNATNQSLLKINDDSIIKEFETSLVEEGIMSQESENINSFKGFRTASFKPIHISEQALEKTKGLFFDIDNEEYEGSPQYKTEEQNFALNDSTNKLLNNSNMLNGYDIDKIKNAKTSVIGFLTASNKDIKISKKALQKSKSIFQNINDETSENDYAPIDFDQVITNFKTEKPDQSLTLKNASSESVQQLIHNKSISNKVYKPGLQFEGFKTANNKSITVSAKSVAKYKNIFEDIVLSQQHNISEKHNSTSTMHKSPKSVAKTLNFAFQTASQKPVEISEESLMASQKLLNNSEKKKSNITCTGLQTASNKHKCKIKENHDNGITTHIGFGLNTNESLPTLRSCKVPQATNALLPSCVVKDRYYADMANECNDNVNDKTFIGFQTASNKKLTISKEALNMCKNIFSDIDIEINNDFTNDLNANNKQSINSVVEGCKDKLMSDLKCVFKTENHNMVDVLQEAVIATSQNKFNKEQFKGFHTASKKNVQISKEALAKTANIFDGIDFNMIKKEYDVLEQSAKKSFSSIFNGETLDGQKDNEVQNLFNTQVINNFEDTLYTEDFLKDRTPLKSKRSGSPLLSCPKAKKRKFVVPASVDALTKEVETENIHNNNINVFTFDRKFKKQKLFKLYDLLAMEKESDTDAKADNYIYNFNIENILEFQFRKERNEIENKDWNTDDIKQKFLDSVNKKLVPTGWIENHLKLIIFKLINYEKKFPYVLNRVCTVRNVMEQLKYRYDRELYNVQRPAFRKILEKDDVPNKTLVLCVVGVYSNGTYIASVPNHMDNLELLLTDGWYCIKACIDQVIAKHVCDGKISVGTKLMTHGAELINCEQGIAPWEDTSSVRLKIFGNSSRRARWDERLGYHSNPAILTQLSSVKPEGGKVSRMRLFVTRVYPTLYIEKFDDGSTVTRSERLENIYQMKYESERQLLLEKVYEEVEKEFHDMDTQDSESIDIDTKLDTGSQIAKLMKKHKDPAEFRSNLTESQLKMLQEYNIKHKEKQIERLQTRVREKIKNSSITAVRNIVPLQKIRVASVEKNCNITHGILSIWRPNESLQVVISEGKWVDVYNVVPTAIRYTEIQLSAGRQTIFQNCDVKNSKMNALTDTLTRRCYPIRSLATNPQLITEYKEIDTVGFIIAIEPTNTEFQTSKQLYQNVYIADENKHCMCINFWGGIKKFGFENILDTGQIIACVNLQKRSGNFTKNVPQYRATEFTYFTKTPKHNSLQTVLGEFIQVFSGLDKIKFLQDCIAIKNNLTTCRSNNTDVTPYRMNNTDYNISKHKMFIDSPVARDDNLNLSGLDFESTFKQRDTQNMSPQEVLRKKKVNERIAKLKVYGEPPPLSPINIINKSKNAATAFKSPLTDQNGVKEGSNVKGTDNEHSSLQSSPVLPFRQYRRPRINPIKLNFNRSKENVRETSDPFAEEFEGSPPLSLD
ncbi:unnamed protein product [Leptosia nina]|uniref:Uncharacterized protein n=1 Tax=Leptosia nina TaxID=320188 RepID=A0AAV1JBB7_9NEOP